VWPAVITCVFTLGSRVGNVCTHDINTNLTDLHGRSMIDSSRQNGATLGSRRIGSLRAVAPPMSALVLSVSLTACGGSSGPASASTSSSPPTPETTINSPTVINLYPHQSATEAPIFTVMVTSVGSVPVHMPLGFDTGSAGVTLDAQSIFPASMVDDSGFVFPAGQASITYNGITVTNVQGTRSYGTLNQTVEHGNLGFATLTFGDAAGQVMTQTMPVFLFYSVDYVTGNGYMTPVWQGWFGVATTDGDIAVAGSIEPTGGYGACTAQSTSTCYVVSAMKYIDYGNQVNAGFMLSPTPAFPTCDITSSGSCAPQGVLTVGLNAEIESGFSTSPLTCPPNGYVGPADIGGYPVCQKTINDVTIAASGASTGTYTGGAIFDTGTAYVYLSTPTGSSFPDIVAPGSTVSLTTPSGFTYSYTSGTGTANTVVAVGAAGNSIIGVQYFTTNYFLLDFKSSLIGWK
jgi:hypothetical protein